MTDKQLLEILLRNTFRSRGRSATQYCICLANTQTNPRSFCYSNINSRRIAMRYWKQLKKSWLWKLTAALGIIMLCSNVASAAYMDGLTPSGHWKLDENKDDAGFSGYLNEITGLSTSCAGGGCPTTNTGSLITNSLFFNGTSNGIDVAWNDLMQFPPSTSWSLEYWMRKATSSGSPEIILARDAVDQQLYWWMGVSNDDKARIYLISSNGPTDPEESFGIKGTSNIVDGEWHHIVAVKQDLGNGDGSTQVMLYVDGVLETSDSTTFVKGFMDNAVGMTIGYMNLNGTTPRNHFNGSVDDVAVYKLAIDEDTIRQHYINGKQGYSYDEDATPSIVMPDPIESIVGYPLTIDVDAVGNPVATYELVSPPAGMTIDAQTGEIEGTLSAIGDTDITVRASSTAGQDEQAITVSGIELCATDLMAHWTLDEDANDAIFSGYENRVGTTNDGTCVGTCPSQIGGQASGIMGQTNYAQAFSGAQGIDVEASDAFNWVLGNSFTIAFWMQRDGNPSAAEVIIGRDEQVNDMHWWVGISRDGQISFWLLDSDGMDGNVRSSRVITDNAWHHVAAVMADKGQGDGSAELRLYLDGSLESSLDVTYTGSFQSDDRPLNIGYLNNNGSIRNRFTGQVDEIAIYHRAFTDLVALQHSGSYPNRNYCNSAPEIDTAAPTTATEGQEYSYTPTATDEEEDSLAWSLDNQPSGMTVDSATGVVTWTPDGGVNTSGAVTLTVDDGYGGADAETFTITVNSNPSANHAPSIDGQKVDPITMVVDTPREITLDDLVVSDQDNDTLQLEAVADGDHFTVSNFAITPEAGYTGTLTVAVMVTDGQASSNSFNLNIVVVAANAPLEIQGDVENTTINAGETFTYNPAVANPQGFSLTWELSNEPDGMTVAQDTGTVSWTPAEGITTSGAVTLTVSGGGESDSVTFTVTVNDGGSDNGSGGGGGGGGCFIGSTASGAMPWGPVTAVFVAMLTVLSAGIARRN
jgi:hypothetical protein